MSNYIVKGDSLTAIADSIRTKTGNTDPMVFPDGFVEALTGITDEQNAVAKIDREDGNVIYFKTVQAALETAEPNDTVIMVTDSNEPSSTLMVRNDITLDLNCKHLTASCVTALTGSHVIDSFINTSGNAGGVLKVARNNLVLNLNNKQLPIWNGVDGYVFSDVIYSNDNSNLGVKLDEANDTVKLTYIPWFDYMDENYIMDDVASTGVKTMVRMNWTQMNTDGSVRGMICQEYVFTNEDLKKIVTAQGNGAFACTLDSYSQKNNLTITAVVASDRNVEICGTVYQIN